MYGRNQLRPQCVNGTHASLRRAEFLNTGKMLPYDDASPQDIRQVRRALRRSQGSNSVDMAVTSTRHDNDSTIRNVRQNLPPNRPKSIRFSVLSAEMYGGNHNTSLNGRLNEDETSDFIPRSDCKGTLNSSAGSRGDKKAPEPRMEDQIEVRPPSRGSEMSTASRSCLKSSTKSSASRTKDGARGNRRKLDPKIFSLSMELIEHVSKGRMELAEKKINQGANPNYADYDKRTPLHLAASEGHLDLAMMLLDRGANPVVEDRWGSMPYDDAVKHGFMDIATMLRKYAEPDEEDSLVKEHHDGLELLEYCARGLEKLVRDKIKAGAQVTFADYDQRTPLHLVASEGHRRIAHILLRNGADATCKDRFGRTPVDDAMKNGHLDVLKVMQERGVKIPDHIFDKSHTPEFRRNMLLIDVAARGKIGKLQKLLKQGADPTFADYDLRTPLHLACAEGHFAIVRLLVAAGADVSAEDRWHSTAFEEAAKYGHDAVLHFLENNSTPISASVVSSAI